MFNTGSVDLESGKLFETTRSLFYGYMILVGSSVIASYHVESFISLATLSAIAMVSAGISDGMEDDWSDFMRLVAVANLLLLILLTSVTLSFVVIL